MFKAGDRVRVLFDSSYFTGMTGTVERVYVPDPSRCDCCDLGIKCSRECKIPMPTVMYFVNLDQDQIPEGFDPVIGFLVSQLETINDFCKRAA